MANLHVGQRVRIRCKLSDVNGQETRIVALNVLGGEILHLEAYDFTIPTKNSWRGAAVDIPHPKWPGGHMVFRYEELEPILDDYTNSEWYKALHSPLNEDEKAAA